MKKISILTLLIFSIVLKTKSQDIILCLSKLESITLYDNGKFELLKKDIAGKEIAKLVGTYGFDEFKDNGFTYEKIEVKIQNSGQVYQYSVMRFSDGRIARLTEMTGKKVERHYEYSRFGCDDFKPQW
jgi:hypothetical protein